jgi:asparagine N-glycosylation enzyme membrane subunit Stt3
MKKIYILLVGLIFINQQEIFSQGPWTFSNSNDVWESSGTAANLTTSATYSILEVNGAGNPQLRSYQASIDANIKNTAVIKLKNNTSNTVMRVFYNDGASLSDFSDVGSGWKYTNVTISANDTEIKTYYVKLDSNAHGQVL